MLEDGMIETLKQALEALENTTPTGFNMERDKQFYAAITALRTAIEQAEKQEPVAKQKLVFVCSTGLCHYKATSDERLMEMPKQEPVALETVYETIIHWDEGGGKRSRRELARRIVALYTTPPAAQPAPVQEPLGYWNAVEGWVELPEEAHKPTAWVYPEALEAFRQGKPWTAYGANGSGPNSDGVERTPLYTTPPAQPAPVQEPVGEVVVESMGVPGSDAMQVRIHFYKEIPPVGSKVYTTPLAAQRQWVRLTESDRRLICFQWQDGNQTATEIIDLVEVKLKERNHG